MLALTGLCSALPSMTVAESCKRVLRADAARCTLVRQQSSWGALVMRTIPDIDFMIVATAHTTAFDSFSHAIRLSAVLATRFHNETAPESFSARSWPAVHQTRLNDSTFRDLAGMVVRTVSYFSLRGIASPSGFERLAVFCSKKSSRMKPLYYSTPVRKCQEHLVGQPRHSPRPLNATLDGHGL